MSNLVLKTHWFLPKKMKMKTRKSLLLIHLQTKWIKMKQLMKRKKALIRM